MKLFAILAGIIGICTLLTAADAKCCPCPNPNGDLNFAIVDDIGGGSGCHFCACA